MITKEQFLLIKEKYGHYASWAIWADIGDKPKSNIGDLSIFDIEKNSQLLEKLKPNIVMVGLNISREIERSLGNFHDLNPRGQDYKIRYALKNSKFEGAYMTDIIKGFEDKISSNVMKILKQKPEIITKNIETFKQEIKSLNTNIETIIAFGNEAYKILKENLGSEFKIIKIPHYSQQISKAKYQEEVLKILNQ